MDTSQAVQLSLFAPSSPATRPAEQAVAPIYIGPSTSLYAAIAAYIAYLTTRADLADSSRAAMRNDLKIAGAALGMNRPVGSISKHDLDQLIATLSATSRPATVERRAATVNGLLRWLAAESALPDPPLIRLPRAESPLPTVLSRDQVTRLLEYTASLDDPRPAFLVRLALTTALKRCEIAALRVEDLALNADPPHIAVRNAKKSKQRNISVPAALSRFWNAYRERYNPVERVFPVCERHLDHILEELGTALKMPVNFSVLRWTAALRDFQSGMDPERLRRKLGLSVMTWTETLEQLRRLAV